MRQDGQTPQFPDRWKDGEKLTHENLNRRLDAIQRQFVGCRPPTQRRPGPRGGGAATAAAEPGSMAAFKIVDQHESFFHRYDTIVCHPWADGAFVTTEVVYVAKPWRLRRSWLDQQSPNGIAYIYETNWKRYATVGATSLEPQVINEPYYRNDMILALYLPDGATLVGEAPNWIDVNMDGRAWAKEYIPE